MYTGASKVYKTSSFDLPVQKYADGTYKLTSKGVFCCMTSDFFLDIADEWRQDCWSYMRTRNDIDFTVITKRIVRLKQCVPPDWGDGYDNVTVVCTVENQRQCDIRLPALLDAPVKHKMIACEPLLGSIDMRRYLDDTIKLIIAGGESGQNARVCDYSWILSLREQAVAAGVDFYFKQTGARFLRNGRLYRVPRAQQHRQARLAGINTTKNY